MDLWVRSQDKKHLVKIDIGLKIRKVFYRDGEMFVVEGETGPTINKGLGQYESEKRALEILDKIQFAMQSAGVYNGLGELIQPVERVIYEMPKE